MYDQLAMFDTKGLLAALKVRNITQAQISRALGLPSSRIAEIFGGRRQVKLDEAAKLVEAFDLEPEQMVSNLFNEHIARLLVLHILIRAGVRVDPAGPMVAELAADLQAFVRFVQRLHAQPSQDAVVGFLEGRRSGRESQH